jgi:hypothetical protein
MTGRCRIDAIRSRRSAPSPVASPVADRLKNAPTPDLTRRPDPLHYGDVHVGTIAHAAGNPGAEPQWKWLCGFYPGTNPGEQRGGTADTFDQARAAFEAAWLDYLPRRTEADFQVWRDQQAWAIEKYRRRDRGHPMPPDWRVGELRPPKG